MYYWRETHTSKHQGQGRSICLRQGRGMYGIQGKNTSRWHTNKEHRNWTRFSTKSKTKLRLNTRMCTKCNSQQWQNCSSYAHTHTHEQEVSGHCPVLIHQHTRTKLTQVSALNKSPQTPAVVHTNFRELREWERGNGFSWTSYKKLNWTCVCTRTCSDLHKSSQESCNDWQILTQKLYVTKVYYRFTGSQVHRDISSNRQHAKGEGKSS